MMKIEVSASYGVIHFYICCFAFVWRAEVSVRRTKAIEGRVEANARRADVSDNERAASKGEREASGGERRRAQDERGRAVRLTYACLLSPEKR